jgi:DnaJ-class molecular chaperone
MDHYNTLGIAKTASSEDIKQAFRKLAMQHHPDRGGDIEKFQEVSLAYETLSDPDKRAAYDNPRVQPRFTAPPSGFEFTVNGFNLNDIFNSAFKQGSGGAHTNPFMDPFRQQGPGKQVYRTQLGISLLESYHGVEKILQVGTPEGTRTINIKVPEGINTGNQVRYDAVLDNAHLIIDFVVSPDLKFERRGNDLYTNIPISILDLIVGTKLEFNTINERLLSIVVPPGTQPYMSFRLSGEGMPIQNTGKHGDQIILLKPITPANIADEIVEAIQRNQNK